MKKYIHLLGLLCIVSVINAQTYMDALRYSQPTIGGTARSIGMGGAFGALGGDFSTLSTNPAGIGVYRGSEFTFSPEIYGATSTSRYYNNETVESKFNFNISNLGYVACFNEDNGVLKSVNFGIGFNRIANFNRNTIVSGDNPYTSYADYMAADANTYGLGNDESNMFGYFTTSLFYDSHVIRDELSPGSYYINPEYLYSDFSFIPTKQDFTISELGRINEWAFSLGANFGDMFYLGGTFGIQPVYYENNKTTSESDASDASFQYFDYSESLKVSGTGYTAKLGLIFKPVQMLRLGAAFHLPVAYHLSEKYSTNISSAYINWDTYYPVDVHGNDLDNLQNDYTITTPAKAIGSIGLVFGKLLVLSGDLEYVDYTSMRIRNSEDNFDEENNTIRESFRETFNLKAGAEVRLGSYYFRGGGGYYGSPYSKSQINSDANKMSFSLGFGIREKSYFFDVAYQYVTGEENNSIYGAYDGDGVWRDNMANVKNNSGRVTTTIGFRF
jgi:hypothetical protein